MAETPVYKSPWEAFRDFLAERSDDYRRMAQGLLEPTSIARCNIMADTFAEIVEQIDKLLGRDRD